MLFLSERDVTDLITTAEVVPLLDAALRELHLQQAANAPRARVRHERYTLHTLPAAMAGPHFGTKVYLSGGPSTQFVYLLFGPNGLEALIAADQLGRIRTGAAAGLVSKYLARADASRLTIIGSGSQAWTQIEAICAVRPIEHLSIVNRSRDAANALGARARRELDIEVEVTQDAQAAIRKTHILSTVTSAKDPVFDGYDLPSQIHINAVGSNRPTHREIDERTLQRAALIVIEDRAQAELEAGDLLLCPDFDWNRLQPITALLDKTDTPQGITLFESLGIGLWDLAVAKELLVKAKARGLGRVLNVLDPLER